MNTQIGLISDPHANPEPLKQALELFSRHQVDEIICLGDIAGYGSQLEECIDLLEKYQVKSLQGNHELWYMENHPVDDDSAWQYFQGLPRNLQFNIAGISIYAVHASPPDSCVAGIRLLDREGTLDPEALKTWQSKLADFNYDVLVVGHTHQVYAEKIHQTLLINPGSSSYNHSCAIISLPDMHVDFYGLCGRPIKRSWNWGLETARTDM